MTVVQEEVVQTVEAWKRRVGTGKEFREQELWRERVPRGTHNQVVWCGMDRRLAIKRALIAALRAQLVDVAGPGRWIIN